MRISIIVAIDLKRGIGKDNRLLFKIREDFERMSRLTRNHPIVMGRKTFESIGRILPKRTNIVITGEPQTVKDLSFYSPEVKIVTSLAEGIEQAKKSPGSEEAFIFGGAQVFSEAIEKKLIDKLYLTVVEGDYQADKFFPEIPSDFKVVSEVEGKSEGYSYKFIELEK
jgi:dihydrofolate reductase